MAIKDAYATTDQGNITSKADGRGTNLLNGGVVVQPNTQTVSKPNTYTNTSGMSTKDAQTMLKNAGYDIGSYGVDGVWGRDTQAAWDKYQADQKAAADKAAAEKAQRDAAAAQRAADTAKMAQQQAAAKQQLAADLEKINGTYNSQSVWSDTDLPESVEEQIRKENIGKQLLNAGLANSDATYNSQSTWTDNDLPVEIVDPGKKIAPPEGRISNPLYPITQQLFGETPRGVDYNTANNPQDSRSVWSDNDLTPDDVASSRKPNDPSLDRDLTPDDIAYQDYLLQDFLTQMNNQSNNGGQPATGGGGQPATGGGGAPTGGGAHTGGGPRIGEPYYVERDPVPGELVPGTPGGNAGGGGAPTGGGGAPTGEGGAPTGTVDSSTQVSSMPQYYGQSFAPWINDWYLRNGAYQNEIAELNRQIAEERVKYNTDQAVRDLQAQYTRGKQDYDNLIKANAITAAQAADNLALRNAANGDRGGIGAKLYSDQQASYDANLYNIQLEQINLKNQVDQKVADYIAQGQYELANTYAEIGNQLLQNLQSQENAYLQNMNTDFWNVQDYAMRNREEQKALAEEHLKMGYYNAQDLQALGIDQGTADRLASYYADQYDPMLYQTAALQRQIEAARSSKAANTASNDGTIYERMAALNITDPYQAYGYMIDNGYSAAAANTMMEGYEQWLTQYNAQQQQMRKDMISQALSGFTVTNKHEGENIDQMSVELDNGEHYSARALRRLQTEGKVGIVYDFDNKTITYVIKDPSLYRK